MAVTKSVEIDLEVNAAIESRRRSFAESHNDILRRALLADDSRGGVPPAPAQTAAVADSKRPGERMTGRWTVMFLGRRETAPNLKGAYRHLLLLLHAQDGRFLARFAGQQARARRFVARSPEDLYLNSPDLAKHHAKPLVDGWFFDTNLSTDQVARRARIAARIAGLRYGEDVRILNGVEEI
jgi:negative regulator of replication initiation